METYQPIENYGIIGDLNTAVLVGMDGSIDFMCFPAFDSPTVFAALLDHNCGGFFKIAPTSAAEFKNRQNYFPDTNILLTRFLGDAGIAEISDFMAVQHLGHRHSIIRRVKIVRGEMSVRMICNPKFDYGRCGHTIEKRGREVIFTPGKKHLPALRLRSNISMRVVNGHAVAEFKMRAEDDAFFILEEAGPDEESRSKNVNYVSDAFKETINYWLSWMARSNYQGRWREMVNRSALTLKLLTSLPYGSLVAAPTFGLPETIGGQQNWDYRYTWIRDGRKPFLYSRVMCWLAVERALKIARANSYPAPAVRWLRSRNIIFQNIYKSFWNDKLKAFVRYRGGTKFDASAFLLPPVQFISANDPRWMLTLKAMERDLLEDSLVYRFHPDKVDSNRKGRPESTFTVCSFWYVQALARGGDLRRARFLFEKLLGYPAEVCLAGDSVQTLRALIPLLKKKKDSSWRSKIERNVEDWWKVLEARAMNDANPLNPQRVFWELSPQLPDKCILCSDSGSAANWFARDLKMRPGMMASLSGTLATMGPGVPYAIGAKFAFPDRVVFALVGDGAMQMNGTGELVTIAKYWKQWKDPRLIILVLNNRDLNQVTWEQRVLSGDPKFETSQNLPDFPYATYAEMLGLQGIRLDKPDAVAKAWRDALKADRPVVIDAYTDPEVPPLPPHITIKQARHFVTAMIRGDVDRGHAIRQAFKDGIESFLPHSKS